MPDLAALSHYNHRNRLGQDLRIKQQRPIVHIVKIETNAVLEVRIRTSADLPEPRHSRLHAQPRVVLPVSRRQVIQVIEVVRPRPDQAHVAEEDVIDLRQLVEAEPAQPFSDSSNTRVVWNLDHSV